MTECSTVAEVEQKNELESFNKNEIDKKREGEKGERMVNKWHVSRKIN